MPITIGDFQQIAKKTFIKSFQYQIDKHDFLHRKFKLDFSGIQTGVERRANLPMDHHVGYHTIWNHSDCAVICFGPLLLHFYNIFTLYWSITFSPRLILVFYKPHSHPNGFYWGHQCSLTHTLANSINVFNMQSSDDCNRKEPGLKPDCL